MKWSFQKVTAMIAGLTIFLLGGWVMNLVKLVNGGDLQFGAGMTLARIVGIFVVPVGSILGFFLTMKTFSVGVRLYVAFAHLFSHATITSSRKQLV